MRLPGDSPQGHPPRAEPLHELRSGLNLIQINLRPDGLKPQGISEHRYRGVVLVVFIGLVGLHRGGPLAPQADGFV